ncbi:Cof-type HAD-IIB family hydrolase [Xylocopilactobacillus apicola]|uniref:Haloacid dehalogenase n=1 Tax=Xylocopilactobacillus apicola TaxID=2932184 RepID=A0AAU9DT39_9LACO|nr:Cof-type HAD-IIB family hydrolase [Xylocopilactobacillus apicola]BDR59269.1 haloacid dehalogenase [Xylocopilactobacillus apicola]
MIKAIALDMDNTLLNNQKQISAVNKKALKELHEQGVKIILCSGRPYKGLKPYLVELELLNPGDVCICFNGGLVETSKDQTKIASHTLTKSQLAGLYEAARSNQFPLDLVAENHVYSLVELGKSSYEERLGKLISFENTNFADVPEDEVFYKAIMLKDLTTAQFASELIKQSGNFHVTGSYPEMLEILPPDINKAVGLKAALKYFDLKPSELVAFGDEANDQEMLEFAGIGVAMGNATAKLKAVANEITLSNVEDGVAVFLQKISDQF